MTRFATIVEAAGSDGSPRFDVLKYGAAEGTGERLTQKRTREAAEAWCRTAGWTPIDGAPELIAEGEGGLTPMQRKVLNRFAASSTLRKRGLL